MSDYLEVDGRRYFEEGYLNLANENAVRLTRRIAALETENARLKEAFALQPTTLANESFREEIRSQMIRDYLSQQEHRDADTIRRVLEMARHLERHAHIHPCGCPERDDPADKGLFGKGLIRCNACYGRAQLRAIRREFEGGKA